MFYMFYMFYMDNQNRFGNYIGILLLLLVRV